MCGWKLREADALRGVVLEVGGEGGGELGEQRLGGGEDVLLCQETLDLCTGRESQLDPHKCICTHQNYYYWCPCWSFTSCFKTFLACRVCGALHGVILHWLANANLIQFRSGNFTASSTCICEYEIATFIIMPKVQRSVLCTQCSGCVMCPTTNWPLYV